MTWLDYHRQSERFSSDAEVAARRGERGQALELYAKAAQVEELALQEVELTKFRTYGITAVSAVSLHFKASEWEMARNLAYRCLGSGRLPNFAYRQIEELIDSIKIEQAGIDFNDAHILLSISGGGIVTGGAPLDLVVTEAQIMKSLFYRTTEFLKQIPHRRRGEPSSDIQDAYRPWLFQAAPGSYQFTVSLKATRQLDMFDTNDIQSKQIVDGLFGILQACVESPVDKLPVIVDDVDYRNTFLKLTRDLAPTGKWFARLDIKSANEDSPLVLNPDVRSAINHFIREDRPPSPEESEREIRGVLRALHLDNDWIEVKEGTRNLRIEQMREEVDDRIGPMVNHPVVVQVAQSGEKLRFLDIEADE